MKKSEIPFGVAKKDVLLSTTCCSPAGPSGGHGFALHIGRPRSIQLLVFVDAAIGSCPSGPITSANPATSRANGSSPSREIDKIDEVLITEPSSCGSGPGPDRRNGVRLLIRKTSQNGASRSERGPIVGAAFR